MPAVQQMVKVDWMKLEDAKSQPMKESITNVRSRWLRILLMVGVIVVLAGIFSPRDHGRVGIAAAKAQFLDVKSLNGLALNQSFVYQLALADTGLASLLAGKQVDFVSAVRLSYGESGDWRGDGCRHYNCALLTLYNYTDGGTIEALLNLDTRKLLDQWLNPTARPGAGEYTFQRALQIANSDARVRAILGDLSQLDIAMVPMSAWLQDDACATDWCLDLTFHAPDKSGRIFHVFVNMQRGQVARTFYSRARADRPYQPPLNDILAAQGNLFDNGCHEQYGWDVCWDMTAHDGVNFRDATYNGAPIFSSIKIGQVEVWYPSWPGGYRDEIGFQASVPPKFGTQVTDLGDGFEVRQLFTEPFDWPNCICCYRYEEIITFYADGGFEPRFISHGPGCDDPSTYRPTWRLDLNLDGQADEQAWLWQDGDWSQLQTETEFDLYQNTSPLDEKLAILADDLAYRWHPTRNDPFGVDEARIFVLKANAGEGEGSILTGAANTFQPPSQWLNDESLVNTHPIFWYVPILKTKKGGPWWCMPDPAPETSPCEAVVRLQPGGALTEPTMEELAQMPPTPTRVVPPTPAATATPTKIEGSDALTIINNAGCTSCHQIGDIGEAHKVGPDLSNIGVDAAARLPDFSAADYIRQSILEPNAFLAPVCPNSDCLPNVMPQDYGQRLTEDQLRTVVAFLLTQRAAADAVSTSLPPTLPPAVGQATPTPMPASSAPPSSSGSGLLLPVALTLGLILALIVLRRRAAARPPTESSE